MMNFGFGLVRYPAKIAQGIGIKTRLWDVPFRCGVWPVQAEGETHVQRVTLTDGKKTWTEECDVLACGFNLVPNVELPLALGCELNAGFVRVNDWQQTSAPDVYCAGEPTGIGGADCALVEGQIAGYAASGQGAKAESLFSQRAKWHAFRTALAEAYALRDELKKLATDETLLCRCEDVTIGR
jgi:NADPH-dependent 2,4-dienoyl-CoA reductase/sulfur reductase-like enzyme